MTPRRSGWMPPERRSVSAMFLMNGYVVGSWAPKIPEFKDRLGIDSATLGLMILAFGLGSLLLMPAVGAAIAHRGSQRIVQGTALVLAPLLLAVTLAPTLWSATLLLAVLGGFIGGMDVAMNANAVAVERGMRRAIMSSCHGFWSLGGLIGSASGGPLLAAIGPTGHALAVMLACLGLLAAFGGGLLHDRPEHGPHKAPLRLPRSLLPWLIGLVALFCMVPEGAILDWGALYIQGELGGGMAISGFGFAAFSATMALTRFGGDPIRDRLGAVPTLRISTLLAALGLVTAGLAPAPWAAVAGFAVAGLGIANMVPIVFSAAGNLPGLPPGIGLSLVSFMGYSGILVAPSAIGFIAAHTGLGPIFLALPLLYLLVLAMSRHAHHADPGRD